VVKQQRRLFELRTEICIDQEEQIVLVETHAEYLVGDSPKSKEEGPDGDRTDEITFLLNYSECLSH
jgi:hypothetical protein